MGEEIVVGGEAQAGTPLPCRTWWISLASCQSLSSSNARGTGQQRTISSVSLLPEEDDRLVLSISNRGKNENHHRIKTRYSLN